MINEALAAYWLYLACSNNLGELSHMDNIEQEIQSKGLTAPRVMPADIEATIAGEYFVPHMESSMHPSLACLTICVLVLKNGFTVTGESACASPENFDAEIGQKIARANAVNKIWLLEGYLLKQRLADARA